MADMIMNIITGLAILVIIYVVFLMVRLNRSAGASDMTNPHAKQDADEEYTRIAENVRGIEFNRQPNTGVHHDGESVYISRGVAIKDHTSFFKLINR